MLARDLSGHHINDIIRFTWLFPDSNVSAAITGALMEVHHDGEFVTVWLSGFDSNGEKTEFELDSVTPIE